jgi:uncharacterized integral membrane protein
MTLPTPERPEPELPPQPPLTGAIPLPPEGTVAGPAVEPPAEPVTGPPARPSSLRVKSRAKGQPFTRVRAAWVGVWAGLVAVILLIVFIGQNTAPIHVQFLWLDGQIPTALALLIAGVGGAVIALAAGAARIVQLRRTIRRDPR